MNLFLIFLQQQQAAAATPAPTQQAATTYQRDAAYAAYGAAAAYQQQQQQQQQAATQQVQVQKTVADTYYQPTTYSHYDAGIAHARSREIVVDPSFSYALSCTFFLLLLISQIADSVGGRHQLFHFNHLRRTAGATSGTTATATTEDRGRGGGRDSTGFLHSHHFKG